MLKVSKERNSSAKNSLCEIFQTMSYNENEVEDFSSILRWIDGKENRLSSVLNGKAVKEGGREVGTFSIGETVINVPCLDGKRLESIVEENKAKTTPLETLSGDSSPGNERLEKFEQLMKRISGDLCKAESMAHQVPLPQIQRYDMPTWNLKEIMTSSSLSALRTSLEESQSNEGGAVHIVWRVEKSTYNLRNFLSLLTPAIFVASSKASVVLSLVEAETSSASCVLPPAFLIDKLNNSGILANPIDLLITTEPASVLDVVLRKFKRVLWCGNTEDIVGLSARLHSGGLNEIRLAVHFIVDSSADVGSAVESIAAETWTSGSKVRSRVRSLLFVHQPAYAETVERLKEKVKSLRTSGELTRKSVDFIILAGNKKPTREKVLARVFPEGGDLEGPTVLNEVGTASEMIAMPVPGRGHILCVIPWRSVGELGSLMGSRGDDTVTSVYSSDCDTLKKLLLTLRGSQITVNSSPPDQFLPLLPNINNWALLSQDGDGEANSQQPSTTTTTASIDEFVSRAEKALKAWASVSSQQRLDAAHKVLNSTLNKDSANSYLVDLMRLATRDEDDHGSSSNNSSLTIRTKKPIGLVGIVILHPQQIIKEQILSWILGGTVTGNAPIVISVSGEIDSGIVSSIESVFPPGLVNFTSCSSVKDSLRRLITTGRVSNAFILLPPRKNTKATTTVQLNEIPFKDFSNLCIFNAADTFPVSSQSFTLPKLIRW